MCSTKWDMCHKMWQNSSIFQFQSPIDFFPKSKFNDSMLYCATIYAAIQHKTQKYFSNNSANILEILKLCTHFDHIQIHSSFLITSHKQYIKYCVVIFTLNHVMIRLIFHFSHRKFANYLALCIINRKWQVKTINNS